MADSAFVIPLSNDGHVYVVIYKCRMTNSQRAMIARDIALNIARVERILYNVCTPRTSFNNHSER